MIGKIFKYILVILLGMVLGAGAVVGGVYLLATRTKVGTITGYVPSLEQYLGESISDMTVPELVQALGDPSATVGTYTEYFPFLNDALENLANSETLTAFASVDLDALKALPFSELGANLGSVISVTASLSSLSSSLNFTLPDLPLFTQTENYVKVTDDAFEISNLYYKDKTAEIYYVSAETGDGAVYAHAYDAAGDLLSEAQGKALFFRSEGIDELPVTDAISALSASLDVAELTVGDLKEDFGIDLLGSGEGIVNELIAADDKINEIADKLDGRIDGIELGDVIEITADSTPILRALEHTSIAELDGRIQTITLKEVIEIDQTSAPILIALQDTTVTGLGERVKTLTLGEVVNTEDNAILEYLSSSTMDDLGGKLNDMPLSTFLNLDEGGSAGNAILDALLKDDGEGPTTISNLTERINALKISDVYETDPFVPAEGAGRENCRYFTRTEGANGYIYTETEYTEGAELYQVESGAGIWLILLYDRSDEGGVSVYEQAEEPPLAELATYIQTRLTDETTGIGNCSLQELYEIGFISAAPAESFADSTLNSLIETLSRAA